MTHYDIFRGQLAIKYPLHGYALWEPSPLRLYGAVEVGDVGFIREGRFYRLFNALLSADHPSHKSGVPEYHEPLIPKLSDHITRGTLSPGHYCSVGIDMVAPEPEVRAFGPDDRPQASFSCRNRRGGAVLSLPVQAQRQDTLARGAFGKWMVTHVDRWFAFAQQLELGIRQMEELILVTGCDHARSWTNITFLENQLEAEVSFGVEVIHGPEGRISWQVSPEPIRGVVLSQGPSGTNLPENQCIFIRGFRVARTLGILPKHLRAAVKPSTDVDKNDWDSGPVVGPISILTVSKDPLHLIFGHVAGRTPECDMVLVHDDDLARISGIYNSDSLETLRPDMVENYLQGSHAEIHTDLCHLSPANSADPQIVSVAMLSMTSHEPNLASQSPLASLASENVDPHYNTESSAINPRGLQGCEDGPQESLVPVHMGVHRCSAQNTTPPHQAISVDALQAPQPIYLLQIPPELIIRILLFLSPLDIVSCGRTCQTLYDLCSDSILRYIIQMERCAVRDDMSPGSCHPERLRILKDREEAWKVLDFRGFLQASVPFESTGLYDFTGRAFFLSRKHYCANREATMGYSYITLPSLSNVQDQKLEWKDFSLETEMLDFGLAVYEHDLIAVLTAKEDVHGSSGNNTILQLRLLSFSTGLPHPLAEQPVIFIATKRLPLGDCNVPIEIVGDFLVLFITFLERWNENEDMVFLVRWKKGEAHCVRSPQRGTYTDLSFLSQDTLVMPNLIQNTVELAKIVTDSDDTPRLVSLCVLHLPLLAENTSLYDLRCRAEPNPSISVPVSIPAPSDRPFRDKAEDAIIIFNLWMSFYDYDSVKELLTFVVHRQALFAHIPAAYRACAPFCSIPFPEPPTPVEVPWSEWGPSTTRWFVVHTFQSMRWKTTTAGQRAVALEDTIPTSIIVRDFNPYAVRAARALGAESGKSQEGSWTKQLPNGNRMTLNVEESVLIAGPVFKEDVRSSLPYVEIVTQDKYPYDGVMIDEERILGLKTSQEEDFGILSFDIHVLG